MTGAKVSMGAIARIVPVRLMTSLLKHWSWKERAAAIMYLWYRLRKK